MRCKGVRTTALLAPALQHQKKKVFGVGGKTEYKHEKKKIAAEFEKHN